MSYIHYGNIGDIWKHLPLCSFLENEQPKIYIESNSAYATYLLTKNQKQKYGIYTFYEKSIDLNILSKTPYYNIVKKNINLPNSRYAGSPALAMEILFFRMAK